MKTLFLFLFFVAPVMAAENDVQEFIESCQASLEGRAQWDWSVVRVRTIVELGIKVPVLASFSVNPEIEFFFVKK